jgi:hypothetical protein
MTELGFCGDNCASCPRYIATIKNDTEELKEVALMWKRVGWRNSILSNEEIQCHGCKSVTWCRYNEIRECAINRKINNCGECNIYPCQKLTDVFNKTAGYAKKCRQVIVDEDYSTLSKAFFEKKENLDLIHQNNSNLIKQP